MPETRLWCPESVNVTIQNDCIHYPKVTNWLSKGEISHLHPPYNHPAMRVSLFWSLYVTRDYLYEIEISDEAIANSFWSPSDPRWKVTHMYGFRMVTDLTIVRTIGRITTPVMHAFLSEIEMINMHELCNTVYWQELTNTKVTSYAEAIACLLELEPEVIAKTRNDEWSAIRRLRHTLEQSLSRMASARYFMDFNTHIHGNFGSLTRFATGEFVRTMTLALRRTNQLNTVDKKVDVEWLKHYRTLHNTCMVDCILAAKK